MCIFTTFSADIKPKYHLHMQNLTHIFKSQKILLDVNKNFKNLVNAQSCVNAAKVSPEKTLLMFGGRLVSLPSSTEA